jgi:hypothetical protein
MEQSPDVREHSSSGEHHHHHHEPPEMVFQPAEHGEQGHVCTAECRHEEHEASHLADQKFADALPPPDRGETGHVCGPGCDHGPKEAGELAKELFTAADDKSKESPKHTHDEHHHHDHDHHHHHEDSRTEHICSPKCEHAAHQQADSLASELFDKQAAHGEKGHVCHADCQHSRAKADELAGDLFEKPAETPREPKSPATVKEDAKAAAETAVETTAAAPAQSHQTKANQAPGESESESGGGGSSLPEKPADKPEIKPLTAPVETKLSNIEQPTEAQSPEQPNRPREPQNQPPKQQNQSSREIEPASEPPAAEIPDLPSDPETSPPQVETVLELTAPPQPKILETAAPEPTQEITDYTIEIEPTTPNAETAEVVDASEEAVYTIAEDNQAADFIIERPAIETKTEIAGTDTEEDNTDTQPGETEIMSYMKNTFDAVETAPDAEDAFDNETAPLDDQDSPKQILTEVEPGAEAKAEPVANPAELKTESEITAVLAEISSEVDEPMLELVHSLSEVLGIKAETLAELEPNADQPHLREQLLSALESLPMLEKLSASLDIEPSNLIRLLKIHSTGALTPDSLETIQNLRQLSRAKFRKEFRQSSSKRSGRSVNPKQKTVAERLGKLIIAWFSNDKASRLALVV